MPIAPLMQQFIDDELKRSAELIESVRLGTINQLTNPNAGSRDSGTASARTSVFDLIDLLQGRRQGYVEAFVLSLRRSVVADLHEQSTQILHDPLGDLSGTLTLVDESRVESDIEIARVVQRIQELAEWELRELQTFTSTLSGHLHVITDANPLRPLFYARALWDAVSVTTPVVAQRHAILRASGQAMAQELKKAWAAAATRLESQGVKPGIYRTVVLAPGSALERAVVRKADIAGTSELVERADSVAESSMARHLMGDKSPASKAAWPTLNEPSVAPTTRSGLPPLPEFEESLLNFEDMLRAVPVPNAHARRNSNATAPRLRDHQQNLNAGVPDQTDREVIDLLSRLFDIILSDVQLHPGLRILIARLQASALRVALREPAVMTDRQHPVWGLIELMGKTSALYTEAGDPRLADLLAFCETLTIELTRNASQDGQLYRQAIKQLEDWLATALDDQRLAATLQIEQLSRTERRNALQQQLASRLRNQLGAVQISEGLRHFVTDSWAQVLAESFQRYGEHAEPTVSYVKVVDDLLWSLNLPNHPKSRRRLLALLPSLLQHLRMGMAMIHLPTAAQDAVMAELMAVHTEALRPGAREQAGGLSPQSAEQIVQALRDEVIDDEGPRSFADSLIDVASMDTVPAELITTRPPDMLTDAPQRTRAAKAMELGARRRVFLRGRWMRVQLLWRSPQGTLMLFAGESAGRTHSITERALQRLMDEHLLLPLEDKTLVQRAIGALYRELS